MVLANVACAKWWISLVAILATLGKPSDIIMVRWGFACGLGLVGSILVSAMIGPIVRLRRCGRIGPC